MATYYVDNNRGLDTNDGLTPATAWKNINKISSVAVAGPGDAFLLADDSVWSYNLDLTHRCIPPATWTGSESNPVVVGSYTPSGQIASRPLLERYVSIQPNEWVYSSPNNAWTYTAPAAVGNLCYVLLAGTWIASRVDSGLPLATVDGRYHNVGSVFYLYAPSTTDPTTYYGEVRLGIGDPLFSVSSARRWVKFQGLEFRNIGSAILAYSNNVNVTGVVVDNVKASYCGDAIRSFAETSNGTLRVIVRNCDISKFSSAAIAAYTPDGLGFKQLDIHNNHVYDGIKTYSQGGIYIQARSPGFKTRIFGNLVHHMNYGTPGKTADGCAIYLEVGSDDTHVVNNVVHNCHLAMQDNSGRRGTFMSNLIYDCKSAIYVSDQSSVGSTDHKFWNNTCIIGASVPANAGSGTDFLGWRAYKASGTPMQLSLKNNLFVNRGVFSDTAAMYTPQSAVTWTGSIENNSVYGFAHVAQKQYSGGTQEPHTGTVLADPQLDANYRPKFNSPLLGAGVHVGYTRDLDGKQRPNPPSIGAFDVAQFKKL